MTPTRKEQRDSTRNLAKKVMARLPVTWRAGSGCGEERGGAKRKRTFSRAMSRSAAGGTQRAAPMTGGVGPMKKAMTARTSQVITARNAAGVASCATVMAVELRGRVLRS